MSKELIEHLAKEQGLKPVAYTDPMNILSYRNSYTVTEDKTKTNTVDLWTADQLEAMCKAYAQTQGQSWISVEERLPEPKTDCIVWMPSRGSVMVCKYFNTWSIAGMPGFTEPPITHWMPLPAAPIA